MAEINTGLGWAANDMWLTHAANTEIARIQFIGGAMFPNQPMNAVYAISDVTTANGTASAVISGTQTQYMCNYIAPDLGYPEADILLCYVKSGSYYRRLFITNVSGAVCAQRVWDSASERYDFAGTTAAGNSYSSAYNLYYRQETDNRSIGYIPAGIPVFDTQTQAFAAVQRVSTTFTKDSAGFAVACVAKWLTQNGTELISPILISSDTSFVDMTTTATGYNLAKLNYLLNGTRFYMAFWDIPGSVPVTTDLEYVDLTERGNMTLEQLFMTLISTSYAHIIIISSPDPYETEGGSSGEEGGDGEDTGDDDAGIEAGSDFPSAINTGFCRIFSPSESDLRNLSNYLWSNSYDIAQVKKLFSNPMDSILGLSAVPIRLLGSSVSFSLGGVPITGMTLPLVSQQRYTYHMGSITIKERWGSYLDYDPYTKFSIFLPFIGMRELAADDIMGKTIGLVYDIDILTGMCVARLQAGTNCLYEWGGNCAIQLPINSRNWDSVFSTAVSAVGGIVSAVTGGSAPLVAGSVASAALQTVSMKPRIDKSSTIGGAAGWLGQMTPYIIRTTPEAYIPTDQNKFIGYPAYINVNLGEISGYNEVESIHLENVTATGAELDEIETILKGGVIF